MSMIINPGSPDDRASIALDTRKHWPIPNEQIQEIARPALEESKRLISNTNPSYQLRSLTSTYNCMGLVFASRRTWIEPDHFWKVADDDGYKRVESMADVRPGDIAVYMFNSGKDVAHVGIIIESQIDLKQNRFKFVVLSQFGKSGEYIHYYDDLPQAISS